MPKLEAFLERTYREAISQQSLPENFIEGATNLRNGLRRSLGEFPSVAPSLHRSIVERKEFETYIRERIVIQADEDLSIPVYVLTPRSGAETYPAVLAVHGHGYGSREIVGLTPEGDEDTSTPSIHQHFAVQLVNRGMKVFAPEVVGFGDRILECDRARNIGCSCNILSKQLLLAGKTLAGLRVHEALRVIDVMLEYRDVARERLGAMGFSGGGLIAAYASALDDRIHATVLCGFTNTFKGSIIEHDHCIDNYIPGILKEAELPDLIGLIAPRKLFIESGEEDPIFPVDGVNQAMARLQAIYSQQQAKDRLSYDIFAGNHEISGKKSYDWLLKSLT